MNCLERMLVLQQKYYSLDKMDIVTTWLRMGNVHQHMRSHPFDVIPFFLQGLNLYESIERPQSTLHMIEKLSQMIDLEMRRLNSSTF